MMTTTFTWDVNAGIPVVLDDGTAGYVYGPSGLISQKTATDDFYYLADGLGSTMAITDDAGAVVRDYQYDVYGDVTRGTGSTPNEFDFAGQQTDGSTGLQYLRARYYDPETGTFLSRDPLADAPGWLPNSYSYVGADPVNGTDPLGLCKWYKPWQCGDHLIQGISGASGWVKGQLQSAAGIGQATLTWIANVGWNTARATVNAPLTAWALSLASVLGGACQRRSDGIWGCFGLSQRLFDQIGARAVTIGNVILTREKSWDALGSDIITHEIRHADQWALAGLGSPAMPLLGQAVFAGSYGAAQALFGTCGNPFEKWAGIGPSSGVRRSCR